MGANDWATLASIATCITCIATFFGIPVLVWQIIGAKKTLNTKTCCNLFEFWMSKEMEDKRWLCKEKIIWPREEGKWETATDFKKMLDQIERESGKATRDEINKALFGIWDFFEHMGVLVKHGGLDIKVAQEYWRDVMPHYWEPFEPVIKAIREDQKKPHMLENFENLYRELKDPVG